MEETSTSDGLSLPAIDSHRTPEERARDGKSGAVSYRLTYHKDDSDTIQEGKVTEIGDIDDSAPQELRSLSEEGYTHYAIFRLTDRSTTTVVQDSSGSVYKAFVLGRNNVRVSYPTSIIEASNKE